MERNILSQLLQVKCCPMPNLRLSRILVCLSTKTACHLVIYILNSLLTSLLELLLPHKNKRNYLRFLEAWMLKREKAKKYKEKYYKNMMKLILMKALQAENNKTKDSKEEEHNKSDVKINEPNSMITFKLHICILFYFLFAI